MSDQPDWPVDAETELPLLPCQRPMAYARAEQEGEVVYEVLVFPNLIASFGIQRGVRVGEHVLSTGTGASRRFIAEALIERIGQVNEQYEGVTMTREDPNDIPN